MLGKNGLQAQKVSCSDALAIDPKRR